MPLLPRLFALAAALWCIGLLAFILKLPAAESQTPIVLGEGIVVPTGGAARLATGLELQAISGGRLLITGVHSDTSLAALAAQTGRPLDACCVDLDRGAANTAGNAAAAAAWAGQNGIARIRLVTSWYHMPRSLLLFERAMPEVAITAHPVFSQELPRRGWWRSLHAWRLIVAEYMKLLWIWVSPGDRN